MRPVFIIAAVWFSACAAFADITAEEVELRAHEVGKSLRCVVCQNQSIDESDAPLAADMRRLVRVQIADGKTNQEVIDFMRVQYGDYVLLKPPVQGNTLVLWLAPLGLVLLALGWPAISGRKRIDPQVEPLTSEEAGQLKKALKDENS